MGWTVGDSNPGECEIFRTRLDRLWGPPSLPYSGYRVSFQGSLSDRGVALTTEHQSSAEVKERVFIFVFMVCSRVNFTFLIYTYRVSFG